MNIVTRYRNQNTKGLNGIKKVISEEITIVKYKIKIILYNWYYLILY